MDLQTLQDRIIEDKIPLSSALLHVKQLTINVGYDNESQWLNNEIAGYPNADNLPSYRQIHAPVKFICESPVRNSQLCSLESLEYHENSEVAESFKRTNSVFVEEPLVEVETAWKHVKGDYGKIEISDKQRELLQEWFSDQLAPVTGYISKGWNEIPKTAIVHLFNGVKVKLLDILNYLQINYPQLKIEQMAGTQAVHISGNNNPINIINGQNNVINSTAEISEEMTHKLKQAGVTEEEIENLNRIIIGEPPKSQSLKDKVNKWLKGLSIAADCVTVGQHLLTLLSI